MQTAAKRFLAVCGMVVMLVLVASITAVPAHAAENGIYTATATGHYRNPNTGEIEDAGGEDSEVLGQSMVDSAVMPQALVEVDPKGNTYITLRLGLVGSATGVSFQVDGSSVSATNPQEDLSNDTADFRMRVGSEYSVIRVSMYVEPMGRDVVFFVTVSGLQKGSGDFATFVDVVAPEKPSKPDKPDKTEKPSKPDKPNKPNKPSKHDEPSVNESTDNEDITENEIPNESEKPDKKDDTKKPDKKDENKKSDKDKDDKKPAKDDKKPAIQEFDAEGNAVDEAAKPDTQSGMKTFAMVGGIVVAVAAVGFAVWYFGFFKKKK